MPNSTTYTFSNFRKIFKLSRALGDNEISQIQTKIFVTAGSGIPLSVPSELKVYIHNIIS